jgi:hypothetical protein
MEEHFNDFIRDDAWKWYSYGECHGNVRSSYLGKVESSS